MEQLTEEQQKQVKKMDAPAKHMIKQELSYSEEEEQEQEGAVGGAKVKKPPEQTVESDPLPTFVNSPTYTGWSKINRTVTVFLI